MFATPGAKEGLDFVQWTCIRGGFSSRPSFIGRVHRGGKDLKNGAPKISSPAFPSENLHKSPWPWDQFGNLCRRVAWPWRTLDTEAFPLLPPGQGWMLGEWPIKWICCVLTSCFLHTPFLSCGSLGAALPHREKQPTACWETPGKI